ncbi:MAG: formate--tetrahydrofolate ligase, partial [Candidatus Omnitrophica bacterium]|nr:formate--tetrahydrofolate ligase [Candidatus Omnitrophota bacterium]
AEELKVAGAMAVILKEALDPNLVQTVENTPCFVHSGTFADISIGSTSVIADMLAMQYSEYVVTECGFGADLGAEKFFNIKCRQSGLKPDVAVINCSIRALKMHSGDFIMKNDVLPDSLKREDLSAVDRGCSNLEKQVENLKRFGIPIVVCINKFEKDTKKEIDVVIKRAHALGATGVAVSEAYQMGSEGSTELAKAVMQACKVKSGFRYLYPVDMNLKNKIERISKSMYGASEIRYSDEALAEMSMIEKAKLDQMPICMVKNHLSLSNNPKKKGRPRGFSLSVENIEVMAGAGFVSVKCDGMTNLPGFSQKNKFTKIDIDPKTGKIKDLI